MPYDCVYGDLLIGDVGGRRQLLSDYEQMHQAPVVSHGEVVAFVRHRRLHGRGIGWIDAHLLGRSLIVNGHQCRICWTGHISNEVLFVLLLFRTPATSP